MMKTPLLTKINYGLFILISVYVIFVMIYSAQPWGGNYAYQKISDYGMLLVFILWNASPFFMIAASARKFSRGVKAYIFSIGAAVITVLSCYMMHEAVFVSIDAQSALIFLILPAYEWIAFLILFILLALLNFFGIS